MRLSSTTARRTIFAAALLGLLCYGSARAEGPKIYKHVDKSGNVSYSQIPPVTGESVETLNSQPAYRGQGGYSPSFSPYDNPGIYSQDYRRDQYQKAMVQRQQQINDARKKHLADLEAECNLSHRADCSNPETLRYIESTKLPRGVILLGR